jgi:uncharacterized protein (TIGR02996 family)
MLAYLSCQPQVLALLREAKERPEDDTPRLVMADWLDEHGDPDHAEFIRLQLRCASGSTLDPDERSALQDRTRALLDRHGGCWLGPLWRWPVPVCWHRGLLTVPVIKRFQPGSVIEVLPWIDTLNFKVTGCQALRRAVDLLGHGEVNHVGLDLRWALREETLLDELARVPESTCLRSISIAWPLRLLVPAGGDGQEGSGRTPAVSVGFLRRLLGDCPLGRHLTHLASSWSFNEVQAETIRNLGVEPFQAEHSLWMHDVPPDCFRQRCSHA